MSFCWSIDMNDKAWFEKMERSRLSRTHTNQELDVAVLDDDDDEEQSPQPFVPTHKRIITEDEEVKYSIILSYKEIFAGKDGYEEPIINEDGSITFSFPSPEEAGNFFMQDAEKGHAFVIIDMKTNTVVGYSNGDGHFYHVDGKVFQKGEAIARSSEIHPDKFDMPRPASPNFR